MKFTIDSTTEQIQSTGGLALAGKISEKTGFNFSDDKSKRQLVHPEMLRVIYGLFVQGRSSYEDIKLFRHDPFFKKAFNLAFVPAKETLRLYLERIAEGVSRIYKDHDGFAPILSYVGIEGNMLDGELRMGKQHYYSKMTFHTRLMFLENVSEKSLMILSGWDVNLCTMAENGF